MASADSLKRSRVESRTARLIASRFPIVGVFDDIARDQDDLRAAFQLDEMTNGRLQPYLRLRAIPEGGLAIGPTASVVMAAFLHYGDTGGRFNDGKLGAWYAATDIETAIAETVYHNDRRLRASASGFPNRIQMRELIADVDIELLDLRDLRAARPELYLPDNYSQSQAFAMQLRWPFAASPEDGLVYSSVRRPGGTNICIFRPTGVPLPIIQGRRYEYAWDAGGNLEVMLLTRISLS
ncbi:MAG: RES family NAD+ phosphorylase [Parvularculaceae bacterium]